MDRLLGRDWDKIHVTHKSEIRVIKAITFTRSPIQPRSKTDVLKVHLSVMARGDETITQNYRETLKRELEQNQQVSNSTYNIVQEHPIYDDPQIQRLNTHFFPIGDLPRPDEKKTVTATCQPVSKKPRKNKPFDEQTWICAECSGRWEDREEEMITCDYCGRPLHKNCAYLDQCKHCSVFWKLRCEADGDDM